MDYSNIILAGKNMDEGFVLAELDKENCNFEYINTISRTITIDTLIKDILTIDKKDLNDILLKMSECGIKEILEDIDFGIDILPKVYPNFMVYKTVKGDNSFELFEKTDKELVFKEYFDRERINVLIKAESIKDNSTFEKNIEDNDLWGDIENYEMYSNEIELVEDIETEIEEEKNISLAKNKINFLKEFTQLLDKYFPD